MILLISINTYFVSFDEISWFNPDKSKTDGPIECDDDQYDCDVNNCWEDDYCPLEIEYDPPFYLFIK